jgi:hypothetical protein
VIDTSRRAGSPVFVTVARLLGRVESRLVLSVAIIVSLLPFGWVTRLDGAFFLLFSLEFVLRALLIFRGEALFAHDNSQRVSSNIDSSQLRGWQWPGTGTLVLLMLDLLALLSFVPSLLGLDAAETHWLRVLRLSRMLLLLSYWAPLVRDVWSVMRRQERAQQVVLMGFIVLALSFAGAVILEQLHIEGDVPVDYDGDQIVGLDEQGEAVDPDDTRFLVHLWWAFRQIQDPGNMLSSPKHVAAIVVSLGLTIFGLFMVSFLIGLGTDVVRELMALTRLRPPGMSGHTIIVNIDPSTQQLLHELLRYSRKLLPSGSLSLGWLAQLLRNTKRGLVGGQYLVVGRSHDPPDFLRLPNLAHVAYRQVQVDEESFESRTDVVEAQRVVLLADLRADDPDATTIQALLTINETLAEADDRIARRDSISGRTTKRRRARLLIAEVLDESNVPAARAAITGDGRGHTHAFVIPSERLISQFIACVVLRPGIGHVLEELLTSRGHELYTLFFSLEGLGYYREQRPPLPDDPGRVMAELNRRARSLPMRTRVVPVGVLMYGSGGVDDVVVHINPKLPADPHELHQPHEPAQPYEPSQPTQPSQPSMSESSRESGESAVSGERRCLGFIALADNFRGVRELAEDCHARPIANVPDDASRTHELDASAMLGAFVCPEAVKLERVLVCGFRNGTVSMLESLIQADPHIQILLMVRDVKYRAAAWDDFDAHTKLVERQLLRGHHGRFEADVTQWTLTWCGPDGEAPAGQGPHIRIAVGDWSSSRQLTSLPAGFGHVGTMDAVVLISNETQGADARTAKTLMKLETLTKTPRVVAEVLDVELARRLRRRSGERASDRVNVYSIQELRAFFMYQSVVVPSFDPVYTELMGPWDESLVRLQPETPLRGTCSFEQLANHLSREDRVLIGVELCTESHTHEPECRTHVHVAGAGVHTDIDLARLVSVWVVSSETCSRSRFRA